MVRGVTRRIVEIKETGSGYFERAIFFVRMEGCKNASEYTLSQEARKIVDKLSCDMQGGPRSQNKWRKLAVAGAKSLVSAAGGAIAAIIFLKLH